MKVYIETYGCTANMGDSHIMRGSIQAAGCCVVDTPDDADAIIINTCAVTEQTSRSMLKAIRKYGDKRVIVAGCMAAAQPYLLEGMGRDIECAGAAGAEAALKILGIPLAPGKPLLKDKTAIIPIAEGCAGKCTYCIVRLARGPLRSFPPAYIKSAVKGALEMGAKEIFLTAQDTGAYGMDTGIRLPGLMKDILDTEGDYRVRLGMMNPFSVADILDDVIGIFKDPHVYKFAHIPVQSGSDRILKLMGRPYTIAQYGDMVRRIRECIPDITLSTDYIVGFPGETDADFALTMEDLRANRPLKVNITRFSPRPGTPAANMGDLPLSLKKERSRALTMLHHEITSAYMHGSIGRLLSVLVTERGKPGSSVARDDSYHMVVIPASVPPGSRLDVEICGASTTYMVGKPIEIRKFNN